MRRAVLLGLLGATAAAPALAQEAAVPAVTPAASAAAAAAVPAEPAASAAPAPETAASGPVEMAPGARAVHVFVEACVKGEGQVTPAVDWALNHGFEPQDAEGKDGTDGFRLLRGRPGVVFATPDPQARLLLAVTHDRRCTVWAERAAGTGTQNAFVQAAGALAGQVAPELDRTLERAGARRRQIEYRWRAAAGAQEFSLGAVTTTTETPAAQALHMAPLQPGEGTAPVAQPAPAQPGAAAQASR